MLHLTINGKPVEVPEGSTIMEAAEAAGVKVPSLCHMKNVHQYGSCRICVVEVEGMKNLQASCMVKAREGMQVKTHSPKVLAARKVLYELLLSNHPKDCLSCNRNQSCELQELGYELGVTESRFEGAMSKAKVDISPSITRDTSKCILCRRCVTACAQIQKVGAIQAQNRGFDTVISPAMGLPLNSTACAMCGQCTVVCPTGALQETDGLTPVWKALADPGKRVIVQVAPAVRAALGEEFGLPCGTPVTGKMATALHEIGFDDVFDTLFSADLTILEEGTELLGRLNAALTGGQAALPMITSCSPGWIKHIEHQFPGELDHLSTCKSPHTMMGAVVKTFYAEKTGTKPEDMFVVSVMPCTAKKYEIQRPEMEVDGIRDVDAVLTTRELARMIKKCGIDFVNLPEGEFDAPLGLGTGAADIFGVTGGVMEAALRTAVELVTGETLEKVEFHDVRGTDGIKEASYDVGGLHLNVCVASGLTNCDAVLKAVQSGEKHYDFIEFMACPGGCVNGGGQPTQPASVRNFTDLKALRAAALYGEDDAKAIRKSHENPLLKKVYAEYLGEPGGHKAHHILHTSYVAREKLY